MSTKNKNKKNKYKYMVEKEFVDSAFKQMKDSSRRINKKKKKRTRKTVQIRITTQLRDKLQKESNIRRKTMSAILDGIVEDYFY